MMKLKNIIYITAVAAIAGLSACGKTEDSNIIELKPVEETEPDIVVADVNEKVPDETQESEQADKKEKNTEGS